MPTSIKIVFLILLLGVLTTGCKVLLVVPDGGVVTLGSGVTCAAGSECEIDVSDVSFDETFTATANEGYVFTQWRKRERGFFGGSSDTTVRLFTSTFADNDVLLGLLSSDEVFFLEPVFELEGELVQVSGVARFEAPPAKALCRGLDFEAVETRPIRGATVQLVSEDGQRVLASGTTDISGAYSLATEPNTNVFVRVRAELKHTGTSSWDVSVRDNTRSIAQALNRRPMYWLDSPLFGTGNSNLTKHLTATTGWTGASYTDVRSASPFSVLDTIYESMQALLAVDNSLHFPPLNVFWSTRNSTAEGDTDLGEIGGAYYLNSRIFLSGKEKDDDDSFDVSVIAHEWMHFAIDKLGRDDSIGGGHGSGDLLDMRVAFSEGLATALAAIVLKQPQYCDTYWFNNRLRGSGESAESGDSGRNPGWFNETSVIKLVYDLWDTENDGVDTQSIGFAPIFDVIFNTLSNSPAFTSLFSFADYLKQHQSVDATFVNSLFASENVYVAGINQWGDGISHPVGDGSSLDVLPVYTKIALGETRRVCSNRQYDSFGDGNKLSEYRYLRFQLTSPKAVTVKVTAVQPAPAGGANPEVQVFTKGTLVGFGYSDQVNRETAKTSVLPAGRHVLDVSEWQFYDSGDGASSSGNFPSRVCFDVSLSG